MSIPIKKIARHLKIQKLYRSDKEVPIIRLEGIWIADLGFKIGETVTINIRERLLIIEPAEESVKAKLNLKLRYKKSRKPYKHFPNDYSRNQSTVDHCSGVAPL